MTKEVQFCRSKWAEQHEGAHPIVTAVIPVVGGSAASSTVSCIAVATGAVSSPARSVAVTRSVSARGTTVSTSVPLLMRGRPSSSSSSSEPSTTGAAAPLPRADRVELFLLATLDRLLLFAFAHLSLLFFEEGGRDAERVRLRREEEVPQRRHEGGRLLLEEPGEEDLHVFAVDHLLLVVSSQRRHPAVSE